MDELQFPPPDILAEDSETEFKQCSKGRLPEGIVKTICAFANSSGGRIVCGVSEDGQPVGLNAGELDSLQQVLNARCIQAFNVRLDLKIERNGQILVIQVPEAPTGQKPVYIKNKGRQHGVYIRRGSSNIRADDEDARRLTLLSRGNILSQTFYGCHFEKHLDTELINGFMDDYYSQTLRGLPRPATNLEALTKYQAVGHNGDVSYFGLLAFGKNDHPQLLTAPTINTEVTHYRGTRKVSSFNPHEKNFSSREFNGNVVKQFEDVFQHIISKLPPAVGTIDRKTGRRSDRPALPEIAIREVLLNSLAHRDYTAYDARIHVDVYANRLEVSNPGISLVALNRLATDPPRTRNPLLVRHLKELGYVEQKASGIQTIERALEAASLPPAKFENLNHSFFRATLYIISITANDADWLQQFKHSKLNHRQVAALVYLRNDNRSITNSEYRLLNDLHGTNAGRRAGRELARLVNLGILIRSGARKNASYSISPLSQLDTDQNQ